MGKIDTWLEERDGFEKWQKDRGNVVSRTVDGYHDPERNAEWLGWRRRAWEGRHAKMLDEMPPLDEQP